MTSTDTTPAAPAVTTPRWQISYRPDAELTAEEDRQLRQLLFASFPFETTFLTRRFLRVAPAHRWLVRNAAGRLIAHAAVHDKIIAAGSSEIRIGGLSEICVVADHRGLGLMKELLGLAHDWLQSAGVSFAMLFGQPKVYESSGYVVIANPLRAENSMLRDWNPFRGKPMVRLLSEQAWPTGVIDLRGPTF